MDEGDEIGGGVTAGQPNGSRARGAARIKTSSWVTRGLIRIEGGDFWTGNDLMKTLDGFSLGGKDF
jgi:hypothetical protein